MDSPTPPFDESLLGFLTPSEKAEFELIRSFPKSKLWKWFRYALEEMRERYVMETLPTNDSNALWMNRGAINVLNRLLKSPDLVLGMYWQKIQTRLAEAAEKANAPT